MRAGSGMSVGLWTVRSLPSVSVSANSTDGIVAISSTSYSRSSRSRTMSMCSRPRKPQRKPKPSASEFSGSQNSAASLSESFSSASRSSSNWLRLDREQPAEDHRLDLAVAGQRLGRRVRARGQRVADAAGCVTSLMPVIR